MVVSGLPVPNFNDHVREVARMALKLLEAVMSFKCDAGLLPSNIDSVLLMPVVVSKLCSISKSV